MADDAVAVVRAMWEADRAGRIEDVLATMDPEVLWTSLSRPGLSVYSGHDGIRKMRADAARSVGNLRIEMHDCALGDDGSVDCRGCAYFKDGREPLDFEARCVVRDGLIITGDSYVPDGR